MTLRDAVLLAISAVRGSVVKTLLTILGLAVGVGAILAVLALGDAGEVRVEAEIAKMGVDKVWIRSTDSNCHLYPQDSMRIFEATQAPACAGAYTASVLYLDGHQVHAQVAGFDENMQLVHQPKLLKGRTISDIEFENSSTVCLVEERLSQALGDNVLGKWLTADHRRFRIIGVVKNLAPQAMATGSGLLILPMNAFLDTFGGEIAEITLSVQTGQNTAQIADLALKTLGTDGYRADTLEEEINAAREIVRIFVMVLLCVAAVCMLCGAIGVTNVLLISVRERRSEIGLMKALGGSNTQLGFLFLLEAMVYAMIGGLLGCVLSVVLIELFAVWIGIAAMLDPGNTLLVLFASMALGCIAGVAPALLASRLQPVEALNCE